MEGSARDETAACSTRAALRAAAASQLHLAALVDFSQDAIISKTLLGQIVSWNRGAQELFGYTADEAIGEPIAMLVPPVLRDEQSDILARIQSGERVDPLETRRVAKDGREIDVSLRVSAIHNGSGEVTGASSITRDITREKRAETQARRSSRYFELARDMVCTASLDGYFQQLNDAWTHALGWSDSELRARPFVEFVHPDDRAATERQTTNLRTGGVATSFVNRYKTKAGGWRWLEWNAMAAVDEQMIFASARDVTERKRTELALEASEGRMRQILETAHDAFVAIDACGIITDWNPKAETTFGWSHGEALGRELAATIIPERYRDAHRDGLRRFVAGGQARLVGALLEFSALHRDGHEFPIELTISALGTEDGCSCYAFMRDITARNEAAVLLEHQRRRLIEAQSVGRFGSWEWNIAQDTTEWSDELYRIFGRKRDDRPRSFEDFLRCLPPEERADVRATIHGAYETGAPFSFEHHVVRPDGAVRVVHARGEVVMGDDGSPMRMLGTGQDITARHEVERAKDEFISVISHELRTPLTSIRGSLGLLAGGVLTDSPDKAERMLQIALVNTDRLVRLINDILDIERMQSGQVGLVRRSCDVGRLVHDAADTMRAAAIEAGVTLHVSGGRGLLWADRDRVLQTLTNLLSNAIKFSPEGSGVWLGSEAHGAEVVFRVRDQGHGIPPESLETDLRALSAG